MARCDDTECYDEVNDTHGQAFRGTASYSSVGLITRERGGSNAFEAK